MVKKAVDNLYFKAIAAQNNLKSNIRKKRKGAFAFEYIIVLVIMVVLIFAAWGVLSDLVMDKIAEIEDVMNNNPLSGTGGIGGGGG